jgi:succinoglycan biosynthesis transport protein ExoP
MPSPVMNINHPLPASALSHHEQDDDDIDLIGCARVIWRYRLAIAAVSLGCALAVFLLQRRAAPLYEATAQLVVNQSKMSDQSSILAMPSLVASYKVLLDNQSLAAQAVKEFALDKPPHNLTPLSFLAGSLSSDIVRDSNVIVVRVRLREPQLASGVANRIGHHAVELSQRLNQGEAVTARDIIKSQLDQSRTRLADAQAKLQTFKTQAQVELARKDVDAVLEQRGKLLALLVEIQSEKARLTMGEAQLSQKTRIETVKRSVFNEPAMVEALRDNTTDPNKRFPLEMKSEFVNKVYETLEQDVAASRTKLAGLERQKNDLVDVRKLDSAQVAKLSELYAKESELLRLQTEFELSKNVYVEIATKYEQARLQVASRAAQLQMLDEALPPDRPISPKPLRDAVIVLAVVFVLSAFGTLFYDFVATANRPAADKIKTQNLVGSGM